MNAVRLLSALGIISANPPEEDVLDLKERVHSFDSHFPAAAAFLHAAEGAVTCGGTASITPTVPASRTSDTRKALFKS